MSQEKNKVKIASKRCLVSLKACSLCLKSSECDRTVGGQVSRRRFNSLSRLLNAASNPNRVSVQGVESLWDDCRFIPADWGS